MPNYYDILGVSKGASDKEVRQAFRRLARQYHPDVNNGEPSAEEKFKEINEAYSVLSDADSRKKYDRYGDNWKHADQYDQASQGRHFRRTTRGGEDPFSVFGGQGGGIFEQIFGGARGQDLGQDFGYDFGQQHRQEYRPTPTEHPVEVTLGEAFAGASRTIRLQDGRRLEVKIPSGVENGSRVHVSPDGNQGGDFYLVVTVKNHPVFRREGKDLFLEVDVPLDDAVLGGEMAVPTLTGKLALTVPPETPNGRRFRLSGQGMPLLKPGSGPSDAPATRGDLYATVKVVLPTGLGPADLEYFRNLRLARSGNNGATAENNPDRPSQASGTGPGEESPGEPGSRSGEQSEG